jgi:squalene-associated FAD-dependent desaturase
MTELREVPSVGIVGGGLAGMAAATALAVRGCRVELFERRKYLGGRAGSFQDPESGAWVDHCRHVSLGCCTNLSDFCRRLGLRSAWTQHETLNFIAPDGRRHRFTPSRWLPAPLHLAPALWRLRFLSVADRIGIGRALGRLARRPEPAEQGRAMAQWLCEQGQSNRAIELFWKTVLVSALSESLDRIAVPMARKVFTDGMMASRGAHVMHLPSESLHELFHRRGGDWLTTQGVALHLGVRTGHVSTAGPRAAGIVLDNGSRCEFDFVLLAVPWHKVRGLLPTAMLARLPEMASIARFEAAPITAVHLAFDRTITALPHAVLPSRLSHWLFQGAADKQRCWYEVVISASHELIGMDRDTLTARVLAELAGAFPDAAHARLLQARVVTHPAAVFAPLPGIEQVRPAQVSSVEGLLFAGDWTATGWPATMESAVRSGYLAAEGVLHALGRPESILAADLPRPRLAQWALGGT